MQFTRTFMMISIFVVALGLTGWQGALKAGYFQDEKEASEDGDEKDDKLSRSFKSLDKKVGGKETPITVEAMPVLRGDLIQTVASQGRVYAHQKIEVSSEVNGRLTSLHIKDGTRVKKGDILAKIDDRAYKLALDEAEAKLIGAKADYVNFDPNMNLDEEYTPSEALAALEEQLEKGLISDEKYRRQKMDLELQEVRQGSRRNQIIKAKTMGAAEIALERARLDYEKCIVRAPFDGIIYNLEVAQGALISGGTKIADLVNMTELVVKAQVLESEMGAVQVNRRVRVTFAALPEIEPIEGKVQAISPFVDAEKKTVEAILAFKSPDSRIRPGMFAEAQIDARIFEDRLMVPKQAIIPREKRKVVFKVSPKMRAKWEYVKTGVENDEYVEVLSGDIEPGDMVLTDNHFTMGHDTLVKIAKSSSDDD